MSISTTQPGRTRPGISGDEALRIAGADAERVYRDLSGYRIVLALEPDGWHIDYELKSPTALGGGPTTSLTPPRELSHQSGMSNSGC